MTDSEPRTTLTLIKPVVGDPELTTFGFRITTADGRVVKELLGYGTSAEALDRGAMYQQGQEALEDRLAKRGKQQ